MSDTGSPQGWDFTYDWDEADEVQDYGSVIDAGVYQVVISNGEVISTKNGEGMPKLELTIENHEKYTGRKLFDQWYMPNKGRQEPKAFKKTLGFMKARLEAIYRRPWSGTNQLVVRDLLGRRVLVRVSVKRDPKKDDFGNDLYIDGVQQWYAEKNEVEWYFPYEPTGNQTAQSVPMTQPMTMPQPPTLSAPQPANGGAPQPTPAPSQQPTPTASVPTPSAPSPAASAPEPQAAPPAAEQPGEADQAATFRL